MSAGAALREPGQRNRQHAGADDRRRLGEPRIFGATGEPLGQQPADREADGDADAGEQLRCRQQPLIAHEDRVRPIGAHHITRHDGPGRRGGAPRPVRDRPGSAS